MKRLSIALTSVLPRVRPAIAPLSMLAAPFRTLPPAVVSFRALPLSHQFFSSSSVNSTLPSLSESSEVLTALIDRNDVLRSSLAHFNGVSDEDIIE